MLLRLPQLFLRVRERRKLLRELLPFEGLNGPLVTAAVSESRVLSYLGLFSSVGTLACCALPSILVLFGFGATVASFLSAAPWLVTLSQHKGMVFGVAAGMIAANFYYVHHIVPRLLVRQGACPADDPSACARATRGSRLLLWISAVILSVGFAVAYVLPLVLTRIDT
ncbi:MAG: hypothetical protein WD825_04350 [Gemmatimonadaceae bacterium]